jgi:hypothetical protein
MNCGRCGGGMLKTEVYLTKAHAEIKTIFAWRCDHCGRIEYYSGRSGPEANSSSY